MYNIVWKKYLPVIRILMKKAAGGDQQLHLNKTDFEKDKVARKTNARFTFRIVNGIAQNATAVSPMAKELIAVLQTDSAAAGLLRQREFSFGMNSRYELAIHLEARQDEAPEAEEANEASLEAISDEPAVVS